jgi:hypothetical protein
MPWEAKIEPSNGSDNLAANLLEEDVTSTKMIDKLR